MTWPVVCRVEELDSVVELAAVVVELAVVVEDVWLPEVEQDSVVELAVVELVDAGVCLLVALEVDVVEEACLFGVALDV